MTAIAGCVGASCQDLEAVCGAALQALRPYGTNTPSIRSLDTAAFGLVLAPHLLEDQFDRQPLIGGSRYLLVADVRLDNRESLEPQLAIGQSEARTLADADVLLRAWEKWQVAALDRMVGDYAFAVFDRDERVLTLVRDPTGQRPLFFARYGGVTAFASMPSGLLAILPSGLRYDALAAMLRDQPDESELTFFEGVRRVLPGRMAILTPGSERQVRYWSPALEPLHLAPSQYVDTYLETLATAVRPRMRRNSGPLAAQLSSGYDSSSVASTAARLEPGSQLIAFTAAPRLGFDGPVPRGRVGDESGIAAETARLHNMRHVVIRPEGGILAPLREHARLYQQPDRNIVNIEWWSAILRSAREQGATTILTGQLGNLSLNAGGLSVLAEWLRRGEFARWLVQARAAARAPGVRWRGVLINSIAEWLPDFAARSLDRVFRGQVQSGHVFVREEWLNRERADPCSPSVPPGPYRARLRGLLTQDLGIFRKGALADSGVDERDPLADRRVIDLSFRLPPEQLFDNGISRPLVRRALAGRLPAAVLNPHLRGYQGADWYERFDKAEAHALLDEIAPSTAVNEVLDLTKMRAAVDRWPTSGWDELGVWTLYRRRLLVAISTGVFIQEFEPLAGTALSFESAAS